MFKLLFIAVVAFANPIALPMLSLTEVVSIIRTADGKFDVLCSDHTRELVTKQDLLDENVCPHISETVPVDMLFVIDNSGSMGRLQKRLSALSGVLLEDYRKLRLDYKIAVTTTDSYLYKFNQREAAVRFAEADGITFITPDTKDKEKVFKKLLERGISGSGDERGFLSTLTALSAPVNSGFLRDGAELVVTVLSDEDDFSHNGQNYLGDPADPNMITVDEFIADVKKLIIGSGNFMFNSVVVMDEQCRTDLGARTQSIGHRYIQAADITGGQNYSICDL